MFSALGTIVSAPMSIFYLKPSSVLGQVQANPRIWVIIISLLVFIVAAILAFAIYGNGIQTLKKLFNGKKAGQAGQSIDVDTAIETAGYAYDPHQDIFYSIRDAWQRGMGYCRLYDEASAPMGMIIDCEPIHFEYNGKKWLIEFWKGQYDLTTGCEIGIYTTKGPDLNIPGFFNGTFYNSASDEDSLQMALILKKDNKILFTRRDKHWWLTGFKLGEFSEPAQLTMLATITFKDGIMCSAFVNALKKAGYSQNEFMVRGNTVSLKFKRPHTTQPVSRTKETDSLIQKKNKLMCDKFKDITKGYDNLPDKMKAIQKQAPDLYGLILNMGKGKNLSGIYEKIKGYIN